MALADSKIVQLALLGVAVVFFSLTLDFKSVPSSLFSKTTGPTCLWGFIAWLERFVQVWSHQDPSMSLHGAAG